MKKIIFYTSLFVSQYVLGSVFSVPDRVLETVWNPTTPPYTINNPANYIRIDIPRANYSLFFPENGIQPTTQEAGLYSGARNIGNVGDAAVTEWYVRTFGGNKAVVLAGIYQVQERHDTKWGFSSNGEPSHVIKANAAIEQIFWQHFKIIAEDPVGRVLLYRLLIEIRRLDRPNGNGCCEDGIALLNARNNVRTIHITANLNQGFSFDSNGIINFDVNDTSINTIITNGYLIGTQQDTMFPDSYDISLFHELLHWFHFLRHPNRYNESDSEDPLLYRYLLRSYYGDLSELYTWGSIDDEELRTILGSPNYKNFNHRRLMPNNAFIQRGAIPVALGLTLPANASFLNGDDLSENAYRLSRNEHRRRTHMRFGHGACINLCPLQQPAGNRFWLAHRVAIDCYYDITGFMPNWPLEPGGAAQ